MRDDVFLLRHYDGHAYAEELSGKELWVVLTGCEIYTVGGDYLVACAIHDRSVR